VDGPVGNGVERERRWLVRRLPDPLPAPIPIRQGYLAGEGGVSVRIRRWGERPLATVKGGAGRRRVEVEWALPDDVFDALWPLTQGRRVEKDRHLVPVDGGTAELDVFAGPLAGLVLVEVEFDDDASLEAFTAPGWFGPEVTDDGRYTNGALARSGLPPDHPSGFPSGAVVPGSGQG